MTITVTPAPGTDGRQAVAQAIRCGNVNNQSTYLPLDHNPSKLFKVQPPNHADDPEVVERIYQAWRLACIHGLANQIFSGRCSVVTMIIPGPQSKTIGMNKPALIEFMSEGPDMRRVMYEKVWRMDKTQRVVARLL